MTHGAPAKPGGGHIFCHWCWTPFLPKLTGGRPRRFCGTKCRNAYFRQHQVRGGTAYPLLMEWRRTRGKRKGVLAELAALVDQWIEEDRRKHREDPRG